MFTWVEVDKLVTWVEVEEVEVTVEQVEKWWIGSTRRSKRVDLLEKEQLILEAYYAAKQELGIGSRKL